MDTPFQPWAPSFEDAARLHQLARWLRCDETDLRQAIERRWAIMLDNCGIESGHIDLTRSPHDVLAILYAEYA